MQHLWLKFDDRKVSVSGDNFVVGRHSECDLSVTDGRLSREHLKIERFGDVFVASDLGSSNGTTVNTTKLNKPTTLRNGDRLSLGGLEMRVEIDSGAKGNHDSFDDFNDQEADAPNKKDVQFEEKPAEIHAPSKSPSKPPPGLAAPTNAGSIPKALFIIAPICALIVVVMVVGALVLFGKKNAEIGKNEGNFIYTHDQNDSPDDVDNDNSGGKKSPTPNPTATGEKLSGGNSNENSNGGNSISADNTNSAPTPKNQPDTTKIETGSAAFLRKISQNDPKAFLTSEQAQAISGKIKQFANSSELADNIKSARSNAAAIQSLANTKNLKPQFIAVAALAKLGNSRGNVLQTTQAMADVLDKLSIQLGTELADDSLLTVAVYDQGAAGDFMKTRNMLQTLSNQYSESSRTIRTIWFLHKKGKISDAEYDFALKFLAIGAITQNPKDFNVNAEELKLN